MKNKKVILILSIVLIALAIFGFKTIFNNNNSETKEINQKEKISSNSEAKVTFLELGSAGCVPCDMMKPILEEIAEEYKGQVEVVFYDVKTSAGKPYVQEYKIRAIPTQVFLDKGGNEYFRHLGFFSKEEVVKVLQQQGVK